MPKNKNKPNAFLFFMLEWKKNEEKKGRVFPNGLKDVQADQNCNETWKNMSDAEKVYYKTMEKKSKTQANMKKRTTIGEDLTELQKVQSKEKEFKDNMIEYITSLITSAKERNCIQELQFYIIHVNYFYVRTLENNEAEYYPAEIAIAEFSLEKGVIRTYHQIINEKIKIGFTGPAKEYSSNSHHIPINAPFGRSDYCEIFRDICKFLEPGKKKGKFPPLYTMFTKDDIYSPVKSVLSRLLAADEKTDDYLLLYSFEDLFASLHNATIEQTGAIKIEPVIATIELKKDPYAYRSGLECEYHGELKVGILHCSQSYVKRWIFVLCNFCCEPLGILMKPGVHMPNIPISSSLSLNSSFSSLTLNESKRASSALSMTGVSSDYRQRVSERNFRDEQRRRAEADAKPIEVIDYSKLNNLYKKVQEPIERPLRAPFTKSAGYSTDTESIDFSEKCFPSVGRGSAIKKKILKNENSVRQSYAAALK